MNSTGADGDVAPLTPLELASGIVTGSAPLALPPVTANAPSNSPLAALLDAVRPAVHRSPCLVSFSGGYDSSLILAAAVRVARQEGRPDPIPITYRAADAPKAEESSWQEAIIRELGLGDWERIEAGDDLDFVGPVVAELTRRHGLLYPANTHFHAPLIARAAGGSLLTGIGGDQVFGLWHWRSAADVLAGRAPLRPRSALRVARSRLSVPARQAIERWRDDPTALPWLQPAQALAVQRASANDRASEPNTWGPRVPWQAGHRRLTLGRDALERIAADAGVLIAHPLIEPAVVAAIAHAGGRDGLGRRSVAFDEWFADLVPAALSGRQTKASFGEVFWREASQRAAAGWDGGGADPTIVDAAALQAEWSSPSPSLLTALLLQHLTFVVGR